jgi:hypothetical protein
MPLKAVVGAPNAVMPLTGFFPAILMFLPHSR